MEIDCDDVGALSERFWTIPLIGLFYGMVAAMAFLALGTVFSGLVCATMILMLIHGLNRFLHFDGLIDLGDGLVSTGSCEKRMAAMKDTRVGAGGVAFGLMITLLIISCLASVPPELYLIPIAMEVLAKNSLYAVAAFGRPSDGLGNPFVSNARPWAVVPSSVLSLLLLSPFLIMLSLDGGRPELLVTLILTMTAASVLLGALMARVSMRSLGCVNGDLLGATNEISKVAVLSAALVVLAWL